MCGAVKFTVSDDLKPPDACHCVQCRKFSGHYWVGSDVPRSAVKISGLEHVTWYDSSAKVRRGFCAVCGCSMFFDPPAKDWVGISLGAFDSPTDTHLLGAFDRDRIRQHPCHIALAGNDSARSGRQSSTVLRLLGERNGLGGSAMSGDQSS